MGVFAFLLDIIQEQLADLKYDNAKDVMHNDSITLGWLVDLGFSALYVLAAAILTIYVGPGAQGSGVAECMGYLNGVKYPNYISIPTLLIKFAGCLLAVASGLCGGKEGPLIHIGACVGVLVLYLPFPYMQHFRNDTDKRKYLAIGGAAGVSAAFGAPIGGSLFAFELSKPNTFWSFSLTWKVFFASSISTFILGIL